jgi:hypothetical protein
MKENREDYTRVMRGRYARHTGKPARAKQLDEYYQTTGLERKHAKKAPLRTSSLSRSLTAACSPSKPLRMSQGSSATNTFKLPVKLSMRSDQARDWTSRATSTACRSSTTSTVAPPGRRTSKAEAGAVCAATSTKRTGGWTLDFPGPRFCVNPRHCNQFQKVFLEIPAILAKSGGRKPAAPKLGNSLRPCLSLTAHTAACVPFQNRKLAVHNVGHPCCPTHPVPTSIPWSLL